MRRQVVVPHRKKDLSQSETESDADPWTPRNMNTNASKSTLRGTPLIPKNSLSMVCSVYQKTYTAIIYKMYYQASPAAYFQGILSDYCGDECPMIPGIVIHCVNEIEARGLNDVGIYRTPRPHRQVEELKEKFFKRKGMPNLSKINDIHVICGCLEDFLRGLKEPLVTYRLWKDFVNAAENRDKSDMYQALSELPRANRDTIAFIMLHLLRVSQTPDCEMPANNLSELFGPTIVGHSSPEPEPMQLKSETKYQAMVMDRLFEIPEDYWINSISDEAENMYHDVNTRGHHGSFGDRKENVTKKPTPTVD